MDRPLDQNGMVQPARRILTWSDGSDHWMEMANDPGRLSRPFMTAEFKVARGAERPSAEVPTTGRDALSADVPDLVIEEDETTGLPNRIVSRQPSGRLVRQDLRIRRRRASIHPGEAGRLEPCRGRCSGRGRCGSGQPHGPQDSAVVPECRRC